MKRFILAALSLVFVQWAHADCDPSLTPTNTSRFGLGQSPINSCNWGTVINSNWAALDANAASLTAANTFTAANSFTGNLSANNLTVRYPSIIQLQTSTSGNGASISNPTGLGLATMEITALDGVGININPFAIDTVDLMVSAGTGHTSGVIAVTNGGPGYSGFKANPLADGSIWALPATDGTIGQSVVTDGAHNLSFATVSGGGGTPGGSTTQVQFNNSGSFAGDSRLTYNSTTGVLTGSTVTSTNASYGNVSSTSGPAGISSFHGSYVSIASSGTTQGLLVESNGIPAGGAQNQIGAVTIRNDANPGTPSGAMLVLVDSSTDVQTGYGEMEIWNNSASHNDPLLWFHRTASNSSPEIRFDSPSPNTEMVNTSTDNAHGLGKWEPFAESAQGIVMQVNSRSWDNSTFENLAYFNPLSAGANNPSGPPGLYLAAQTLLNDSGIISSSNTSTVRFFTQNNHMVGLQGPLNVASGSWDFRLPNTPSNQGQVLFQSGTDAFGSRPWAFTTGGSVGQFLVYEGSSSSPTWTTTVSSLTVSPTLATGKTDALTINTTSYFVFGATVTHNYEYAAFPNVSSSDDPSFFLYASTANYTNNLLTNNGGASGSFIENGLAGDVGIRLQPAAAFGDQGISFMIGSSTSPMMVIGNGGTVFGNTTQLNIDSDGFLDSQQGAEFGDGTGEGVSVDGGLSVSSTTQLFGGLQVTVKNVTGTYNATSGDMVILASATAASGAIVNLPSANFSAGIVLTISKADASTNTITINANGSDVISGTGTIVLNAQYQTIKIVSNIGGGWIPDGPFQVTPPIISNDIQASATSVVVSSAIYVQGVYVPVPVSVVGFELGVGVQSGQMDLGIYDSKYHLIFDSGTTTVPAAGLNQVKTKPFNLAPGWYYMALTANTGATLTFQRAAGNSSNMNCEANTTNTSFPLPSGPSSAAFGSSSLCFVEGLLVSGGVIQ